MNNVVQFKPAKTRKPPPKQPVQLDDDRVRRLSSSDPRYANLPPPPAPTLMEGHFWMYKYDAEGFNPDPAGEPVCRLIYYICTDEKRDYEILIAQPDRYQIYEMTKEYPNRFMAIATNLHDAITILYALELNPEPNPQQTG